jgi:hypothetical protein
MRPSGNEQSPEDPRSVNRKAFGNPWVMLRCIKSNILHAIAIHSKDLPDVHAIVYRLRVHG